MVFVSFELDLAVTLPEGLMNLALLLKLKCLKNQQAYQGCYYNINNHAFGLALVSVLVSR